MSLNFLPLIENAWLYGFALLALALLVLLFITRPTGFLWRAGALLSLLLIVLNPILQEEEREKIPTTVVILSDVSASNALKNRASQTAKVLDATKLRLKELGFETREIEAKNSKGTFLFEALKNGLSDISPSRLGGVIMITDGQVHDIPQDLAQSFPLHAFITGSKTDKDRRIELVAAPRFGIVGQDVEVSFKVLDEGVTSTGMAMITLTQENEKPSQHRVPFSQVMKLNLPISKAGSNIIELAVEPLEGELTLLNNRLALSVEGVREKLKVLLVSGSPHAGERTWRNLLKSDPTIELVHFTILRPQEKAMNDSTPSHELALIPFPTRDLFMNKLSEFDLVIFDRYAQLGLISPLYYANVANYVENGGALLIAAGPEFARESSLSLTSLDKVLPARPVAISTTAFLVKQSNMGKKHPVTKALKLENTGQWFRNIKTERQKGVSVLEAGSDPLLLLAREKEGRVGLLLSDHIWLWARGVDAGGPHQELLRRTAHWLMKEPDLEEEQLRLQAKNADIIVTQQTLKDDKPKITLTPPSGKEFQLELDSVEAGLWRGLVLDAELGLWKATNGVEQRLFMMGPQNPLEWREVVSKTEKLEPITKKTGGAVFRVTEGDTISLPRIVGLANSNIMSGSDWIGLKEREVSRLKSLSLSPLLLGVIGLLAFLLLMARTWFRESR